MPLRRLRLMGDGSQDSDNLDIPVRPGWEDQVAWALMRVLGEARGLWDFAELNTMPPDSPAANALRRAPTHEGWVITEKNAPASAINLPARWEEYLKMLSAKERGKVGTRVRRLEKKYAVRIRRCEGDHELDSCLGALYHLHGKHWGLRGLPGTLHLPKRRQFYRALAGQLLARRRLELWVLEISENESREEGAEQAASNLPWKIVAVQFGFKHGTTAFSLQEGFDPDYSADSVGYVLRSHVIKRLISDGIRRYDFLGGMDESKERWGAEAGSYLNLKFARPLTVGAAYVQAQQYAQRSKTWLRHSVPAPAWEMLHQINVKVVRRGKSASHAATAQMSKSDSSEPVAL